MNSHQVLGYMRVIDAIKAGEDIGRVICEMANARTLSQGNADIFGGALGCLMNTFQKIKEAGLPVSISSVKDVPLNRFVRLGYRGMAIDFIRLIDQPYNQEGARELGNRIWIVCQVVNEHRKALSWRYNAAARSTKPEPQEIRIIAMPDRKTDMVVQRDANDEIVKTVQVESDIQWATP